MYLYLQLSQEQMDTLMSWKPGIHKLHGVELPREVEYSLSVNLKYLFPVRREPSLVFEWFEKLSRKARLLTFFWQEGLDDRRSGERNPNEIDWQSGLPYQPSLFDPDIPDYWFNEGLRAGKEYLARVVHAGSAEPQPGGSEDLLQSLVLPPKQLHQYLTEARLLSFISDKNLGIVVVTCDWYKTEIKKFLDLPVFRIFSGNFDAFHQETCLGLNALRRKHNSRNLDILSFLRDEKLIKFWNQCWDKKQIPKFHGIPKIHKNPWKLRPIVPMHSYVTSQLAIILHHMLLPIQRSFSWICESSRTLASEVAEFNRTLLTPTRIHTGDVTAMYTSITWDNFRVALQGLLSSGTWYTEETREWIIVACEFLWHHTIFQTGHKLVEQIDGIPMGIHCGPVMANLYMAFYEKYYLSIAPGNLFYRRYIDDCFALHPSDEYVVNQITARGLDLQWEHSGIGLSFLDVWFHTHLGYPEICFRPFEKALNHHQYIPWGSSHPLTVKKGLIKGELSRIRAISYRQSYFLAWKEQFVARLRLRGWPARVLQSWIRQVQWRDNFPRAGLDAPEKSPAVLAVSKYNPVWNEVSSTDLWQTMRTEWSLRGPANQPYPPRCLVSKKRTRNHWDLVRSVNRNLLSQEPEDDDIEDNFTSLQSTSDISMPYLPL